MTRPCRLPLPARNSRKVRDRSGHKKRRSSPERDRRPRHTIRAPLAPGADESLCLKSNDAVNWVCERMSRWQVSGVLPNG